MTPIESGLVNEKTFTVEADHLASRWGSGFADVLATPMLVAFCEGCALEMIDPLLPEGQQTVGTAVDLQHLAATPPGMTVTVKAELVEVDGRRLRFHVEAWDEVDHIGTGEHERFVIDVARFERGIAEKSTRAD